MSIEHSPSDSTWARLKIKKVVSVSHRKGNSFTMLSGRTVKGVKVDPVAFEPLSRFFYDY